MKEYVIDSESDNILILGDLHIGARNDDTRFLRYFSKFWNTILFPYITNNNIKHVFCLGDVLDRRKFVNHATVDFAKKNFFDFWEKNKVNFYAIVGNHDIYYRNSIEVIGMKQLNIENSYVHIISEPTTYQFKNRKLLCVPWICDSNYTECTSALHIADSESIVLGHFELSGFEMYKGINSDKGTIDTDLLKKFESVYSGHYHTYSQKGNVTYIGTPYEITWADCNDKKHFAALDVCTGILKFIDNPFKMFQKIYWREGIFKSTDFKSFTELFLKVYTHNEVKQQDIDKFTERVYAYSQPYSCNFIETDAGINTSGIDIDQIEMDNPLDVLIKTIDSLTPEELDADMKSRLLRYARDIYMEALTINDRND